MDQPHEVALKLMRGHREGTLISDAQADTVRFVIDGATGRLVFPLPRGTDDADELVLFVPEEQPATGPALQLLLTPQDLDPESEPVDHWRAYYGTPRQTRWLSCEIDGAKLDGEVIEPERLRTMNPLRGRGGEARLCKRLNADRAALGALCRRIVGVEVQDPLAVGVDPTGIDVRARFGVIHLAAPIPPDPAAAMTEIERLLGGGP